MAGEGRSEVISSGVDVNGIVRRLKLDATGQLMVVTPGGGGSAVTIADGADVAQGAIADVAWTGAGNGTLVAISKAEYAKLEAIRALLAGSLAVTGPLTDAQLRAAAVPVSGTFWQATQPVSGPLTDTQLRASAVPVSGPLTDAQLRAAVVPVGDGGGSLTVDGTVTANAGTGPFPVSDNAGSLTVDAPVGTPVFARLSDGAAALIGQKAMAASLPITVASDQSAVPTKETPATIVGTTISAANTAVTLTLAAAGAGLFHYITSIEIVVTNPTITAVAAAATNLAWTSTNLGGLAWNSGTLLAAGTEKLITRMPLSPPLRSAVANTASTIVAPACGAGTLCRIQVTYYTAT